VYLTCINISCNISIMTVTFLGNLRQLKLLGIYELEWRSD